MSWTVPETGVLAVPANDIVPVSMSKCRRRLVAHRAYSRIFDNLESCLLTYSWPSRRLTIRLSWGNNHLYSNCRPSTFMTLDVVICSIRGDLHRARLCDHIIIIAPDVISTGGGQPEIVATRIGVYYKFKWKAL